MNEHKRDEMKIWLAVQAGDARAEEKRLMADDRADEAVFAKIRGNVFEIFGSVLTAAEKARAEDGDIAAFFREKLDSIPASWEASREKTRAHDEAEKAHIEDVKLAAVREIRARLREVGA